MRLFRLFIISAIVLFLIAMGISLTIPSHIRISRAMNFGALQNPVPHFIRDTNQWPAWNPLYAQQQRTFATSILQSTDTEVIARLQQGSRRPVLSGWKLHSTGADSVTLQWYMDFELGMWPWQKFSSLFFEATYGSMMQQGLTQLKQQTLALPKQ